MHNRPSIQRPAYLGVLARLGLALFLLLGLAGRAQADPLDELDPVFGIGGLVTTDFSSAMDEAYAVAIQTDGKIVVAGSTKSLSNSDFAVARYLDSGELDPSFGTGGKKTINIGSSDFANAIAIQTDGKIVVGGVIFSGFSSSNFALARLEPNGNLDPSFDGDGIVVTHIGDSEEITALTIQPDGKIVAAGYTGDDFAVLRYHASGSLDGSFSGDGVAITSFGAGSENVAYAVAVQADGKIVAAGYSDAASSQDFAIARYNPDGSLDATFSGDGRLTTDFLTLSSDFARAIAIQADGKLLVAGYAEKTGADFALARYTTDGSLDSTFSGDGRLTTDFGGGADYAFAVQIALNGKIVLAGFSEQGDTLEDFALARYLADGSLDTTFSGDGLALTNLGSINGTENSPDLAYAAAIDASNRIVVAGFTELASTTDFAIARYLSPNQRPAVSSFSKTGSEDVNIEFTSSDFSDHFSDPDGESLAKVKITALPNHATLRLGVADVMLNQEIPNASLSSLVFVPETNWNGTTSFGWNGSDGADYAESPASVSITLSAVNDPPAVSNASKPGLEDRTVNFTTADFTSHFNDLDGDSLSSIRVVSLPSNGELLLSGVPVTQNQVLPAAGLENLDFIPSANWNGITSFNWNASDGQAYAPSGAEMQITLAAVNDAPAYVKGADQTVNESAGPQTVTGWATNISAGPADEAGQTLSFTTTNDHNALFSAQPSVNVATGDLTYTPATYANGNATVTVTLTDSGGTDNGGVNQSSQSFQITINPVNDPPVLTDSSRDGREDTTIQFNATDFTNHFSDIDGDGLVEVRITSLPAHTTLRLEGIPVVLNQEIPASDLGKLNCTPEANWFGNTGFTWNASDGVSYAGNDASMELTITSVNDAPSFTKGPDLTVNEDAGAQNVTGWATNISAGPPNESGQSLSVIVSNTNAALFAVQPALDLATGDLAYTSAVNANGSALVTIRLMDDGGTLNGGENESTQTFTITINPVNDAPSFTKGADQAINEDAPSQSVTGWATDLSAGPPDETGQSLFFIVTNNLNALFGVQPAVSSSGDLTYTPAANANGSALVTVTLRDSGGTANGGLNEYTQTFTITIHPLPDAPSVADVDVSGVQDSDISFTAAVFTGSFTDVDGDSLVKIKLSSLPAQGTLKLDGVTVVIDQEIPLADLDKLVFTPPAGWTGTTSFGWTASDGVSYASPAALVHITVIKKTYHMYLPVVVHTP